MDNRRRLIGLIVAVLLLPAGRAEAAGGGLFGAVSDLVRAVVALPSGIVAGTLQGPLILGTVGGTLHGAVNTVGYTARSALQLVGVAIPMALRAVPYVPLFL